MAVVHYPAVARPEHPVVSVCIANYNGERMLADCIGSVLDQQGIEPGGVEIIIHDDASTDGSVDWLRRHHPQVELLASEENVGFCISNNRMVVHARGEFVLLLNNDAALLPDALMMLLGASRSDGLQGILTLPQYDWTTGGLVDRGCLLDPFFNPVPNRDPRRHDVAMVIGACLFVPATLWRQLGGFPDWMGSVAEDLYLCGRARLRGLPVHALAVSGYRHRQGHSFGGNRVQAMRLSSTYRRRALSETNKSLALIVLTPGLLLVPLVAAHLALLAIEGVALSAARRSLEPWRRIYAPALAAPFRRWRELRRVRRDEQAARTIPMWAWFATTRWLPRKLELLLRHGMPGLR